MPITSHGGVNGASQSSGPLNLAPAAAAEPGDFVTFVTVLRNSTQEIVTPAGWTEELTVVSNTNRLQVHTRICTGFGSDGGGTEPTTAFTWAAAGNVSYWAIARTWNGVDTTNPFIVAPNDGTGTTTTAVTAPAMSPASAGLAVWWWIAYYTTGLQTGPKTVTPPAGLDQQSSVLRAAQTLGYVGIQGSLAVPSGSTGTKVATASSGLASWRTAGMVLREASTGPSPARGGDHFMAA